MPHQRPLKAAKTDACVHLDSHALVQLINRISTDIDILREQLVRHLVFLQDVVVGPCAREGGAEEEAEHPAAQRKDQSAMVPRSHREKGSRSDSMDERVTHPPLKAPTGFRTGMAVAVASRSRADDWNALTVRRGESVDVWRQARIERARIWEAMVKGGVSMSFWLRGGVWRCGGGVKREWVWYVWIFSIGKRLGMRVKVNGSCSFPNSRDVARNLLVCLDFRVEGYGVNPRPLFQLLLFCFPSSYRLNCPLAYTGSYTLHTNKCNESPNHDGHNAPDSPASTT